MQCRYRCIQRLKAGSVLLFFCSPGNNKGNLHFIWQIDYTDSTTENIFQKSLPVVEVVKNLLLQNHTRAMHRALLSLLRQFYRDLTIDCTPSSNLSEAEIDLRVAHVIDMEPSDPDTIFDLRSLNS